MYWNWKFGKYYDYESSSLLYTAALLCTQFEFKKCMQCFCVYKHLHFTKGFEVWTYTYKRRILPIITEFWAALRFADKLLLDDALIFNSLYLRRWVGLPCTKILNKYLQPMEYVVTTNYLVMITIQTRYLPKTTHYWKVCF